MHRAGKRRDGGRRRRHAVAALLPALLVSVAAPSAWAFHNGNTFETAAAAGGGEYIYYSGSPPEHGWKCNLCHTNAEGKISLHFTQPDLFTAAGQQPYTPSKLYKFDVDLVGEHLGIGNSESNGNNIAVQILDADGQPAGAIGAADNGVAGAASTYISDGVKKGATHWTFNWFAPGPMAGPDGGPPGKVTFYVSAVDGNGANSAPGVVLFDPFGDDFFATSFDLEPGSGTTGDATPTPAPPPGDPDAPAAGPGRRGRDDGAPPLVASMLTLAAFGVARRGRRKR
jgi:hypothetical protein